MYGTYGAFHGAAQLPEGDIELLLILIGVVDELRNDDALK